ncbi:uncharacterized protein si:ch211-139g16.8 [Hoplias malabaricus]|uniref:uncharacterized protein si:ch211-139g16.8 n=1 Tax=Hoplias malabaricus TaxID=27720 RepID=UPI003462B9E0
MIFYFFFQAMFILIFSSVFSVSGCHLEVIQPEKQILGTENQSVSITCQFNISSCSSSLQEVLWYVFTHNSHHQLDPKENSGKYKLEENRLHINSLSTSDEGVYYCAVTLNGLGKDGSQAFGNGTTVSLQGHVIQTKHVGYTVLLALMVLLTIYSLIILTLIICVKTGRSTLFRKERSRRQIKSDLSNRAHFGVVVQELYNKRNLRSKKKKSRYASHDIKFENPQPHAEIEDIYQNLDRTE